MEKNENGYPATKRAENDSNAPMSRANNGMNSKAVNDMSNMNGVGGSENRMTEMRNAKCPDVERGSIDSRPLAYVYAPSQRFCMLYSAKDALDHGTLFESLYKPMEVYGRE